jgi:hypothetical protein
MRRLSSGNVSVAVDTGIGAGDGMGVKAGKAILGAGKVEVGLVVRVAMGRDVLVCFGVAVAVIVGCT